MIQTKYIDESIQKVLMLLEVLKNLFIGINICKTFGYIIKLLVCR
jgi:hypothetical protein